MYRKSLHILVIAVLALNLMGAWAFASITDCGMDCCMPGEWAAGGTASYEAPSCCDISGVTCGFEAGAADELFDEAICCFNSAGSHQLSAVTVASTEDAFVDTDLRTHARTLHVAQPPPPEAPLYLSNATFLC
ncbi:MAG: hypothetical protein P1S46_09900 [bacterium]|nr:hypothetical protein [bacterium]